MSLKWSMSTTSTAAASRSARRGPGSVARGSPTRSARRASRRSSASRPAGRSAAMPPGARRASAARCRSSAVNSATSVSRPLTVRVPSERRTRAGRARRSRRRSRVAPGPAVSSQSSMTGVRAADGQRRDRVVQRAHPDPVRRPRHDAVVDAELIVLVDSVDRPSGRPCASPSSSASSARWRGDRRASAPGLHRRARPGTRRRCQLVMKSCTVVTAWCRRTVAAYIRYPNTATTTSTTARHAAGDAVQQQDAQRDREGGRDDAQDDRLGRHLRRCRAGSSACRGSG